MTRQEFTMKYIATALFAATIPAANWMIGNVGVACIPDGPCLVPVGFGLMAPSGVVIIEHRTWAAVRRLGSSESRVSERALCADRGKKNWQIQR